MNQNQATVDQQQELWYQIVQEAVELGKSFSYNNNRIVLFGLVPLDYPFSCEIFLHLWDSFRINNPISLEKFPSIDHIKTRYDSNKQIVVSAELLKATNDFFEKFITHPSQYKMTQIVSNNYSSDNLIIIFNNTLESPFVICQHENTMTDQLFAQFIPQDMMTNKDFIFFSMMNLDGPYNEDDPTPA